MAANGRPSQSFGNTANGWELFAVSLLQFDHVVDADSSNFAAIRPKLEGAADYVDSTARLHRDAYLSDLDLSQMDGINDQISECEEISPYQARWTQEVRKIIYHQ